MNASHLSRLAVCGLLLLVSIAPTAEPGPRPLWTTSRVVGSPSPALPYRVRQTFKNLKVPCPIGVAHEPGTNSLLLLHQMWPWGGPGKILRIADDPEVSQTQLLLAPDAIAYGVAFHPDYIHNGYLFVGSNGPMESKTKTTRVTRYTVARQPPYAIVPGSEKTIIEWLSDGHNGGDLGFGPDGLLFITSGDGTSDSDTNLAGQDLTKLLSKVLRIDVDRPEPGKAYAVPKDTPFVGRPEVRPETWAYGFRNPWRIHVDRQTGAVWVGQNGQDLWEQVYFVERGGNYGWSVLEGSHPFYPDRKAGPEPFSMPIAEHHHSEMRSLTGGVVYRGKEFPELVDAYIYGDWSTGRIWGVRQEKGRAVWHQELAKTPLKITGFGLDAHGELLIADHGGGYYRLERAPAAKTAPPFPRKLSETGIFVSTAAHQVDPGLIPYTVNAPLWSDGATKERFIGLPGDACIEFADRDGWDFPNGAVMVKTFSLPVQGKSQRVETRLLTRQEGEWVGYSYAWNKEQTDAVLVEAGGLDRAFTVSTDKEPGRQQTWHYPSRAECMVCHSRAANWVLGLSTVQMNTASKNEPGQHDQLRELEKLGVFRISCLDHWRSLKDRFLTKCALLPVFSSMAWLERLGYRPFRRLEQSLRDTPRYTTLLPKPSGAYPRLVDPYNSQEKLETRARSYLHSNCAICHVAGGGGNALFDLNYFDTLPEMKLIDVKPLHDKLGHADAMLVAPGDPDRSILLQRIARRGPNQMPPLASNVVDDQAVALLRAWIREVRPAAEDSPKKKSAQSPPAFSIRAVAS